MLRVVVSDGCNHTKNQHSDYIARALSAMLSAHGNRHPVRATEHGGIPTHCLRQERSPIRRVHGGRSPEQPLPGLGFEARADAALSNQQRPLDQHAVGGEQIELFVLGHRRELLGEPETAVDQA